MFLMGGASAIFHRTVLRILRRGYPVPQSRSVLAFRAVGAFRNRIFVGINLDYRVGTSAGSQAMTPDTGDREKQSAFKHVVMFVSIFAALCLMGKFSVLPMARWTGPIIIMLLFIYAVWIMFWIGPKRNL
jgi:hypothetical protein